MILPCAVFQSRAIQLVYVLDCTFDNYTSPDQCIELCTLHKVCMMHGCTQVLLGCYQIQPKLRDPKLVVVAELFQCPAFQPSFRQSFPPYCMLVN